MARQRLETFFSGKLLRIPSYQRDYAWELVHVDDLWGDLSETIALGAPHYIGTFILARTNTEGLYDLVDGQQRLTTLTMLLRALIDRLPVTAQRQRIVAEERYLQDPAGTERLTLLGDNQAFFRDLLARQPTTPQTRSQKRLERAFTRSTELVASLAEDALQSWIDQVAKLHVMEFVEENEGNAIRIFEAVNDRGRPLATIEKVKSFLIYASSKYLGGALDASLNARFGRVFRAYDRIKDLGENRLGIPLITQSRFNEDAVLRYHFLAYPADFHDWGITAEGILKQALKPAVGNRAALATTPAARTALREFIEDYTEDLAAFCEAFGSLLARADTDGRLYKLFTSLELSASMYPLVVRLEMRNLLGAALVAGGTATFLDAIETTELRVYKTRATDPQKDIAQLASATRTLGAIEISARLKAFVERFMGDDLFRQRLRENVYENNEGARFILLEWEEKVRRDAGGAGATIAELKALRESEPTIDHVLAQERTFALDGRNFRDVDHYAEQLHRLGNLTLVEKRINSSAQKKTPEQKASDDPLYKASAYASTRRLGVDVSASLANGQPFGANQVDLRTTALLDFCMARWPIWP